MGIKTIIILVCVLLAGSGFISEGRRLPNVQDKKSGQTASPDRISSIFEAYDGTMSDKNVTERLDALGDYLKGAKSFRAYIVSYAGLRSCPGEALRRARAAKHYLLSSKGISAKRITVIDAGFQQAWTVQLWITAEAASPPIPIPTVDRRKVKVFRKCKLKTSDDLGLDSKARVGRFRFTPKTLAGIGGLRDEPSTELFITVKHGDPPEPMPPGISNKAHVTAGPYCANSRSAPHDGRPYCRTVEGIFRKIHLKSGIAESR